MEIYEWVVTFGGVVLAIVIADTVWATRKP